MKTDALFDAPERERWTGSRALVPFDRDACPVDQGPLSVIVVGQPALFRHGGYGADLTSTVRWCALCGWQLLAQTQETKPVAARLYPERETK